MRIMKVLIIFDQNKYNEDMILDDLREEGFVHKFKLHTDIDEVDEYDYIKECDEVWCFGDVGDLSIFEKCVDCGADIWDMG